jgi:hypothetical protein
MASAFAGQINRFRWRAILVGREYKRLFQQGDVTTREAEYVLADLRRFCRADRPTIFDRDAMTMARREGRREVFVRIVNFLNLDERAVQQLMELDDGG